MARTLVMLALVGCAAAPPPLPPAPVFRLAGEARPLRYLLELQVDPAQPRVFGTVTIDLELGRTAREVWLNAGKRVRVERAEWLVGDRVVPAVAQAGEEFLGVTTETVLPAGRARLRLVFISEPTSWEADGFFHRQLGEHSYLFSHFEPLRARRAFPCFDEPRFKTPWRIVVHSPVANDVVSNMPEESNRVEAGGAWRRIAFRESPPLPSYLVALAVGPFRYFNFNAETAGHTPLRMVVPSTLSTEAGAAAPLLGKLMAAAERRFGPFPFPKLDVVVVPRFDQHAMENAGLITVDDNVYARGDLVTLAHELAHQWFGDLVTCAWFDDTWLNESFAELVGRELAVEVDSRFSIDRGAGRATLGADLRASGRTIRVHPKSAAHMMDSFNHYTYARGAQLLRMLESWMGADAFDRALRRYLGAHAFGSVTTADFVAALSAEAGRELGAVVTSYLDQPGLPIVEAETVCAPGEPARLELRQRPLVGAGRWHIPICFWHDNQRPCVVLDGERDQAPLEACAKPSFAPAGERLFVVAGAAAQVSDLHQLLLAGAMGAGDVMRALPERLAGPEPPLGDALRLLRDLSRLVGAEQRGEWRRYLRRLGLVRQARAARGELRDQLWTFALTESLDPELALEATSAAMAWLADARRDDWRAPWQGVLAGSPRFLEALPKLQDRRRKEALALLGGVQDEDRFRILAAATLKSAPDVIFWFIENAELTVAGSRSAYEFVHKLAAGLLGHLKRDDADNYELRLAVAACIAPSPPPRERESNQEEIDELAVCASLRRQEAEMRAFLGGE